MKTQLRLNSVIPHGVSGPEAGAINLIYDYWLNKYNQSAYSFISINQIGDDLDEVFIKLGKEAHLNIRIPSPNDFESKSNDEKNRIRLEIIHEGLLRIAKKEKKLDVVVLEKIKNIILENNFSFEFVCKLYKNKKNNNIDAKLIVQPLVDLFKYYIEIEEENKLKCKIQVYSGDTTGYNIPNLFKHGVWKKDNVFILRARQRTSEIRINFVECTLEQVNFTRYEKDPWFEMFRTDISVKEREKARQNYENSLPPHIQAAIRQDKDS
jgi:hypothetical protein